MALIFLGNWSTNLFTVSSFDFHQVKLSWRHRPQFTRPQSTRLSGLETVLENYHKLQAKHISRVKDAVQLIWSALPEKAIDNAVKDYSVHVHRHSIN